MHRSSEEDTESKRARKSSLALQGLPAIEEHKVHDEFLPSTQDQTWVPVVELPGPPDGGWGWVICLASFMCNLITDGIAYSFGILLPELVKHYDSNAASVSWVGSLLPGLYMGSGPIVGGLVNKFGCRPVCIAGGFISCLAFVASTFSPNVGTLMFTYGVLGGFGLGLVYLPSVVCCGYYFEKRRALATGIAVCGSGVGCFVFAPLTSLLLDWYGWQGTVLIFAGICLNFCVCGGLMRPLELVVTMPDRRLSDVSIRDDSITGPSFFIQDQILEEEAVCEPPKIVFKRKRLMSSSAALDSRSRVSTSAMLDYSAVNRNMSTPHFGRITRVSSSISNRNSSIAFGAQAGSQLFLQPSTRRKSQAIVRPLSRKDVFYGGSIHHLAQDLDPTAFQKYRHSIISIPKGMLYHFQGLTS